MPKIWQKIMDVITLLIIASLTSVAIIGFFAKFKIDNAVKDKLLPLLLFAPIFLVLYIAFYLDMKAMDEELEGKTRIKGLRVIY